MTQQKDNTQIDNTNSLKKHKPGELTAKQRERGSLKGKIPVQLDPRTTIWMDHTPDEAEMNELHEKYLHFKR